MLKKIETEIDGCYELIPIVRKDNRGCFIKTYHYTTFKKMNFATEFKEEYHSVSTSGVLRGLHFQTPPAEHEKLVYCSYGKVMDVVVDLRSKSSTYGKYKIFKLDSDKCNMIYIPKGMAHGFYTESKIAIMVYKVTSEYSPENDMGILWNSVGIPWPSDTPFVSDRDKKFISLNDFKSPF